MEGRGQLYIAVYLPIYLPTYLPALNLRGEGEWEGRGMKGREGERGGERKGGEGREREEIVALRQANRQIIDFKILPTKLFKVIFLDF